MNNAYNQLLRQDAQEDKPSAPANASGEETISGSSPSPSSDDDTAEDMANVIGNEPKPGKPFSLADEIEKDELKRRGIDPKDVGIDE